MKTCSKPGCPTLVEAGDGRCKPHKAEADRARGTATERGYTGAGHQAFARAVLRRDKVCVMPECDRAAKHADHHPLSRKELIAAGLDPNDPRHGRGLCHEHHSSETTQHQPGGFLLRNR